jgi:NAD(P)H-hydrate repair Nnr-like enzyme with NAD(P)H-hydrate dehydratase domain
VLTPHAGEFERLTGVAPGPDRVGAVREFASRWGVTVLLKGRATLVAPPDGPVLVNEAGGSWAATAGAGDVLAGIIGALLSSGMDPALAAAAGARAHALAANLAASTTAVSAGWTLESAAAPISAAALLSQVRAAIAVLRAQAVGE